MRYELEMEFGRFSEIYKKYGTGLHSDNNTADNPRDLTSSGLTHMTRHHLASIPMRQDATGINKGHIYIIFIFIFLSLKLTDLRYEIIPARPKCHVLEILATNKCYKYGGWHINFRAGPKDTDRSFWNMIYDHFHIQSSRFETLGDPVLWRLMFE